MEEVSFLNPYELLGIDLVKNKSLPKKNLISLLKKNYYHLALLCHPDKGGSSKDMNIISIAYKYIKEQIEDINEVSYEKMEENFQNFCKEQENIKPLNFGQIYEETNDWIRNFNQEFEKNRKIKCKENKNLFSDGYGNYMEYSEYKESNCDLEYKSIIETKVGKKKNNNKKNNNKKNKKFVKEIIEYKEPGYLPDSITNHHFDIDKIDDYSNLSSNLKMSDYKLSFSTLENNENNLEEELRKYSKEFKDFPKKKLEYNPKSFSNTIL